jgi:hypothetical protein
VGTQFFNLSDRYGVSRSPLSHTGTPISNDQFRQNVSWWALFLPSLLEDPLCCVPEDLGLFSSLTLSPDEISL